MTIVFAMTGFILVLMLGAFLVLSGVRFAFVTLAFMGNLKNSGGAWAATLTIAGSALVYVAIRYAPLAVTVAPR